MEVARHVAQLSLRRRLSGLITAQRQTALTSRNIANARLPATPARRPNSRLADDPGRGSRRHGGECIVRKGSTPCCSRTCAARATSRPSCGQGRRAGRLHDGDRAAGRGRSLSSQIAKLSQAFQSLGEAPRAPSSSIRWSAPPRRGAFVRTTSRARSANSAKAADQGSRQRRPHQPVARRPRQHQQAAEHGRRQRPRTSPASWTSATAAGFALEQARHHIAPARRRPDHGADPGRDDIARRHQGQSSGSFSTTTTIGAASAYNAGAGPLSGVTVNGLDIRPGSYRRHPQRPLGRRVRAARHHPAAGLGQQIDEIASALADGFQRADATVGAGQADCYRRRRLP